jgi:hypothetical protein
VACSPTFREVLGYLYLTYHKHYAVIRSPFSLVVTGGLFVSSTRIRSFRVSNTLIDVPNDFPRF